MYIPIENYEEFKELGEIKRGDVSDKLIAAARKFHEANDMEEFILSMLSDPNRTPHGPVEIVDIMTLHLSYRKKRGIAAFILKGRSFQKVTTGDISHQIFRLRRISDLTFALLGHVGKLLDEAREEFVATAEDLGVDYTIIDAVDFARLAVVNGILCPRHARRLVKGRCNCGYRAKGGRLNFLQREALVELRDTHALGQEAGIVIMPTGSGKTRIAAIDSRTFEASRILYVAHTHEILDGAEREFEHVYGTQAVHRDWYFDDNTPRPSVHLSTIQSIARSVQNVGILPYDYLVIDEFHHAAAASYRRLLEKLTPRFLLGLTATPFRGDRRNVVNLCGGNVVVDFELRAGIDGGILTPYQYYGCFDATDFTVIPRRAQGYTIRDLNKTLIIPERDAAIIAKWRDRAEDLPSVAFCCSRKHAERMAASFTDKGIPSDVYLGNTPMDHRAELVDKLFNGEIKVLCAVDVLNEGVDIPFIECLLFLRPTESKRIFYQQLGRGLRRSPGKTSVIVLDFIGNFYNAHRIVEYLGLDPEYQPKFIDTRRVRSPKEILNLPIGCTVEFDDRVIDVFANQVLNPLHATRHNIAQILTLIYQRTSRFLGHPATKAEVDRNQLLHSGLYELVFGSWQAFEELMNKSVQDGIDGKQ